MTSPGHVGLVAPGSVTHQLRRLAVGFGAVALATVLMLAPAHAQDVPTEPIPVEDTAESDARDYGRELRSVEEEVNGLKERVFRSKATLQLLKELVVEGAGSGARVVVWHMNQLGRGYAMESVQYFLDGKNVYTRVDPGGQLASVKEMKVHEQSLPPGTHNIQVKMTLRGAGYGLFSYLRTYQFTVQSSYSLRVEEGRATVLSVIANSRGALKNFVDRPTVRYEERTDALVEE